MDMVVDKALTCLFFEKDERVFVLERGSSY